MIQGPEFVARVAGCFGQHLKGAHGTHGTLCHVGVRQQTEHAKLGQRIGSPAAVPDLANQPLGAAAWLSWRGHIERKKNIDVQQMPVHSSSKNARTCFVVSSGKSSRCVEDGQAILSGGAELETCATANEFRGSLAQGQTVVAGVCLNRPLWHHPRGRVWCAWLYDAICNGVMSKKDR